MTPNQQAQISAAAAGKAEPSSKFVSLVLICVSFFLSALAPLRLLPNGHSQFPEVAAALAPTLVGVGFHRRTGADRVAVAVDIVDPANGRPELVIMQPLGRVGCLLA
jgi:hypothetical protein